MRRGSRVVDSLSRVVILAFLLIIMLVLVFNQPARNRIQAAADAEANVEAQILLQLVLLEQNSSQIEEVQSLDAETVKEQVLRDLERRRLELINELPEEVRVNFLSAE